MKIVLKKIILKHLNGLKNQPNKSMVIHKIIKCFNIIFFNTIFILIIHAFEWFEKSAKQEYGDSQNNLGYFYENGIGITKDLEKAIYWYKKAVENGNENAKYNLELCYQIGKGIEKEIIHEYD